MTHLTLRKRMNAAKKDAETANSALSTAQDQHKRSMSSLRHHYETQLNTAEEQLTSSALFIADLQARLSAVTTEHTSTVFSVTDDTVVQPLSKAQPMPDSTSPQDASQPLDASACGEAGTWAADFKLLQQQHAEHLAQLYEDHTHQLAALTLQVQQESGQPSSVWGRFFGGKPSDAVQLNPGQSLLSQLQQAVLQQQHKAVLAASEAQHLKHAEELAATQSQLEEVRALRVQDANHLQQCQLKHAEQLSVLEDQLQIVQQQYTNKQLDHQQCQAQQNDRIADLEGQVRACQRQQTKYCNQLYKVPRTGLLEETTISRPVPISFGQACVLIWYDLQVQAAQQHADDAEVSRESQAQCIKAATASQQQLQEQAQLISKLKSQIKDAQQQHIVQAQQMRQSQMKWAAAEAARMQHARHLTAVEQQLCDEAPVVSGKVAQLRQLQTKLETNFAQTQQDANCIVALKTQLSDCQTQTQHDAACIAALKAQLAVSAEVSQAQLKRSETQLAVSQAQRRQDADCIVALRMQLAGATQRSVTQQSQQCKGQLARASQQVQQSQAQLDSVNKQDQQENKGQLDGANQKLAHSKAELDYASQQLQQHKGQLDSLQQNKSQLDSLQQSKGQLDSLQQSKGQLDSLQQHKGQLDSLQHSSAKLSGVHQQPDPIRAADAPAQEVASQSTIAELQVEQTVGRQDADKHLPAPWVEAVLLSKQQTTSHSRQRQGQAAQYSSMNSNAKTVTLLQQELAEQSRRVHTQIHLLAASQTCAANVRHMQPGQTASKQGSGLYCQVSASHKALCDLAQHLWCALLFAMIAKTSVE